MAIRGILFDKDGTIIDYWRTWVPINREAALHAAGGNAALAAELLRLGGHDPDTDRVTAGSVLAAGNIDDIANAFAAHLGDRAPAHLAADIERIFCEGGAQHCRLIEACARTLAELKRRGLRLGVATNDFDRRAQGLARSARHPGPVRLRGRLRLRLRHQARPRHGAGLLQGGRLEPREVAVVGDAVHDLAMGRAARAGLNVGVLSGTSSGERLRGLLADLILDSINDLAGKASVRQARVAAFRMRPAGTMLDARSRYPRGPAMTATALSRAEPETVGLSSARLRRIGEALRREVDGRPASPGAVVGIMRAGKLAHLEAVGYRDPAAKEPLKTDAIFSIASMTKAMTSVAVMLLVEEGRVLLGDPGVEISAAAGRAEGRRGRRARDAARRSSRRPSRTCCATRRASPTAIAAPRRRTRSIPARRSWAAERMAKDETIAALAKAPLLFDPGTTGNTASPPTCWASSSRR